MDLLLPQHSLNELVSSWLKEDMPNLDYSAYVVENAVGTAQVLCKAKGVLCGIPFVTAIFEKLSCQVHWFFKEGDALEPICIVAEVSGRIRDILLGERISLNVLSRASGIASASHRMLEMKQRLKWNGEVAGTRKTTPGFRLVEKYALLVGGCSLHRYDLSSMVMLKDNHIWSVGDIHKCVKKAREACGFSTKIEVECRSVNEALTACSAGADIVMLDNFDVAVTEESAASIKRVYPNVLVEVSGGVREDNICGYMTQSVDIISSSALTQGYDCIDYSLKMKKEGHDPANPIVKEMYNDSVL